jgi:hypothetical protein
MNDGHLLWSDDALTAHELRWPIGTACLVRRARPYGVYAVVTARGLAVNMSSPGPKPDKGQIGSAASFWRGHEQVRLARGSLKMAC